MPIPIDAPPETLADDLTMSLWRERATLRLLARRKAWEPSIDDCRASLAGWSITSRCAVSCASSARAAASSTASAPLPSREQARRCRSGRHDRPASPKPMCNLYSMTTTHEAMRKLFRVQSGINQLRLPGIFPDYQAPIVRRAA